MILPDRRRYPAVPRFREGGTERLFDARWWLSESCSDCEYAFITPESRYSVNDMARARMVEVDYYSFRQLLREATDRGCRIEKRDTQRWNAYIKEHNINEVGATAIARARFEEPTPVIIDLGTERDGLYLYSDLEEGCLRLIFQA